MATSTQQQWVLEGSNGFDSLVLQEAPVPKVGDKDVLVRFHAASLNYRDLLIVKGQYPFPVKDSVVPLGDGAGVVQAIGPQVTRFQVGDRVLPIFHQGHLAGSLDAKSIKTGLGSSLDGTLRPYGAFDEERLVKLPENLSFIEGATLPCAALTAWSALYGLQGKAVAQGDIVLTQGTGGVSLFALQFAKASGAKVIATTSSKEKAELLKQLGADEVINYKECPQWGEVVRGLTPNNEGVTHIVEVAGPATMKESLKAIKIDGVISMVGFVAGSPAVDQPSLMDTVFHVCTVRGIAVGSRIQFEEMSRAIEANDIHPVVDNRIFKFGEVHEAYQYLSDQKHVGKVCIEIQT
ncbi:putative quinone oxidoreductase [Aspergillus flavus AF70]|nr:putative quinone oxidoreductase [Aspergillus flavus AF70]